MNLTCLFCKIVNNELPSYTIYNDNLTIAFLDLNPTTRGHTLIIAREHSTDFISSSDEIITNVALTTKKVASHLKEKLNPYGFNFLTNNGALAGQTVMHYHTHIIPKYEVNQGLILSETKELEPINLDILHKDLIITY